MITDTKTTEVSSIVEVQHLLTLQDVRNILQISARRAIDLVKSGKLVAYNTSNKPLNLKTLTYDTKGLRFRVEDIEDYIDSMRLK